MLAVILFLLDALAVRVDIGIAGDADQSAVERLIGAKAAVQAGENDVLEQDVGVGAGGRGISTTRFIEAGISIRPSRLSSSVTPSSPQAR